MGREQCLTCAYEVPEPFRLLVGEVVVDVDLPVDDGGEGHVSGEQAAHHQEGTGWGQGSGQIEYLQGCQNKLKTRLRDREGGKKRD